MAVANAAPITAMTGNMPIAVGFGNGLGAPAGFLFATIVLTVFALGYVAMAKHITTTGAFYGFISHGLGQVWGMASGLLATFAYVIFEGSLIGGCAYFANDAVNTIVGVNIPWLVFAIGAIADHRGAVPFPYQPDRGDSRRHTGLRSVRACSRSRSP